MFRNEGKFKLNPIGFKNMALLMKIALNSSLEHFDIYPPSEIMVLGLTFYCVPLHQTKENRKKRKKIFLQRTVLKHKIYKKFKFWKSSIIKQILDVLLK